MGTIAARDAIRVLELTEQVAAGHLIACVQSVRLRLRAGDLTQDNLGPALAEWIEAADVPFVEEDRPLDSVLVRLTQAIADRQWPAGWSEAAGPSA